MATNVEGATENITADLAALRQEVARLAEATREALQNRAQATGHRISEAVGDTRHKIAGAAADAEKRARAVSEEIEAGIERNPLISLLIAFVIGISLGITIRSRT
jgi:ElaB/YqjD/DUF883 family membrane-anchored ribosome-binding protein